jgi:membrane protein DedA with SNARE-associated domain
MASGEQLRALQRWTSCGRLEHAKVKSARVCPLSLVEHLQPFVQHYGYFAVLVFVALESAGVPMPGETVLISAAIFAGQGTLDIRAVIAVAAIAAIAGDNAGYWLGREFGFPLIYRYGPALRIDEGRLKVAQYMFMRYGGRIVFFGRFVAILRAFAAFLAGVNHLPWPRFLVFNALGGIVWAILFGLGGYWLGFAFEHYARPVGVVALACAVVAIIGASRFIAHHEQALREEAERALPGPLVARKM